jgi:hypothetical protein
MPEHFPLLMSELERGTSSTVMQILKQRVARAIRRRRATVCDAEGGWPTLFP